MTKEFIFLTIAIIILIIAITLIIIYIVKNNKFKHYMFSTYYVLKYLLNTHTDYQKKLHLMNTRTYYLKKRFLNSRRQFEKYNGDLTYQEIEQSHIEILKLEDSIKKNKVLKEKYIKDINTMVDTYQFKYLKHDKYNEEKVRNFIYKYISKNKTIQGNYNISKYFQLDDIRFIIPFKYVSNGGRVSLSAEMRYSIKQLKNFYYLNFEKPRLLEIESEKKKNIRLYGNKIYFFEDDHQPGHICIGQTTKDNVEERIRQEYKNMPTTPYRILHYELAQFKKW